MSSLSFQITPSSPGGGLQVELKTRSGELLYSHFATRSDPAKYSSKELEDGTYSITLTNQDGFQNISTISTNDNFVNLNGANQDFQFVSRPDEPKHFSMVQIFYTLYS